MAGDVRSQGHFDFKGDLPDFSGARSLGGGVGNPSLIGMPNRDARMANAEGDVDSQEDHGLVDMHEFRAVTARVDALETTLNTVNTNLSNLSTLLSSLWHTMQLLGRARQHLEGLLQWLRLLLFRLPW